MALLTSRRLLPLLVTQALGAINDNMFKTALSVLVLFKATGSNGAELVALANGVFILPYMLFSALAGQLADRFEKSRLMVATKLFEVALMAVAALGLVLGSTALLFAVLFGLGLQATLFGPLKYAVIPTHLREAELVAGNGLVEAGTFLGILAGTMAGSALTAIPNGPVIVAILGLAVAMAGVASATFVPRAPSDATALRIDWNLLRETRAVLRVARSNRPIWLSLLGLSWFWVLGATMVAELPSVVRDQLGAQPPVFTLLLVAFSLGVGAGSVGCSRLLRGEVSARLVPFAAIGLCLFMADFARTAAHAGPLPTIAAVLRSGTGWRLLADLLLLAASGGLFSVPLYAILQDKSPPSHRARMVAANNVVNAIAVVAGAVVVAGLAAAHWHAPAILLLAAGLTLLVALWAVRLLPQTTLRAVFGWYFRRLHGVTVRGLEHLPPVGTRAVLVVNHLSLADGAFVASQLPGDLVFAVNSHMARRWWARPFLAAIRSFAVDPANPFAAKTMVRAVQAGQWLVVFPEGRLTRTGGLMKVYEGAGMVADSAGAVIVPIRIDGLQFTPFARLAGRLPRRWFPPLSLTVLPPVTMAVDPALHGKARRRAVGARLQETMEASGFATGMAAKTVFAALLAAQRRFGAGMPIMEDGARSPVSYRRTVLGAVTLGRRLARDTAAGEAIGVMLPNSNGAVVTFMALQAFGRVPAMLNYAAGAQTMLAACAVAGVRTVLCSRAFVERGKLGPVVERMEGTLRFVWLEDLRAGLGAAAKLRGLVDAWQPSHLPGTRLASDAAAVILFTSGSEGTPKGVVLSHRNLLANIAQVAAVVDFSSADRVFNAMPMFHALGLTGATLLPLLSGVRTFHYPSPLHYRVIPELIYDTSSTIAFGTDTFLTGWARAAHPYDFYAVRMIFAGAERLREETRRLYAERFGVRLLEGYGVTEAAPVVALNTPMHSKPGSVGRLLPGVHHRLDPVEGIQEGGRLLVQGPNIMRGYLRLAPGAAAATLEAPAGGWHDTGDICTVDADGFVTVVARAKRFAKIAGEMVSMPAAEAMAASLWPDASHAVVARPDGRKGEALVLLTTQPGATSAALLAHARAQGMTDLGTPRLVEVVDALPLLPTGKVDYAAATRMATAHEPA